MGNHISIVRHLDTGNKGKRKTTRTKRGSTSYAGVKGTFILSVGSDHMQVVKVGEKELLLIGPIIRSHCTVVREGVVKVSLPKP